MDDGPSPGARQAVVSSSGLPVSRGFFKRHARTILASLALVFGCAWLLRAGGLPLFPPDDTLSGLDSLSFAAFIVGMLLHMATRLARYHFLVAPIAHVPLRRLVAINAVSLAIITFLPLRLGEFARPAMLREKGHLSASAILGTVGAERVLDGVIFSAMLLGGLALAVPHDPLPTHIGALPIPASLVTQGGILAGIVFGFAFVVMVGFYWRRAFARRVTERVIGVASKALAERVAGVVERLSDGLKFLSDLRYTLPYLLVTLVSVGVQAWSLVMLADSVGLPEVDFTRAVAIIGLMSLGFAMPNAPGFFGAVQLVLYAGLAAYVPPDKVAHEGAAFVFLFYVSYLAIVVGQAALGLLVEYTASPPIERAS